MTAPESDEPSVSDDRGSAESIRDAMAAAGNAIRRKHVQGLWEVLCSMKRKGMKNYTIATVGRACEAARVLKTQTIRNAAGADYRVLIRAFAAEMKGTGMTSSTNGSIDLLIGAINDIDTRTRLKYLLEEHRRQKNYIERLHRGFRSLKLEAGGEPKATEKEEHSARRSATTAAIDLFPIEKFLSTDWIDEQRWTVNSDGAIYDEHQARLTPIGFANALRELIQLVKN